MFSSPECIDYIFAHAGISSCQLVSQPFPALPISTNPINKILFLIYTLQTKNICIPLKETKKSQEHQNLLVIPTAPMSTS